MNEYQLIVIGSGPGGYVAAIRASQLGFNTAIVERERLGGICLNWGCIPTKALLKSAHLLEEIRHASDYGIKVAHPQPDFKAVIARSRGVAEQMAKGVEFLMKKNKISVIPGTARFKDSVTLEIENNGKRDLVRGERIIVATGARARSLPGIEIDGRYIIGYREAMSLGELPEELCIIGAGAIGVEFADFYSAMGSKVTLIEALPRVLPVEDEEVSALVEKIIKKKGIEIFTKASGIEVKKPADGGKEGSLKGRVAVNFLDAKGEKKAREFDRLLLAVGIIANTEDLNLDQIGVKRERDRIVVDDNFRTNVQSIRAIGDCIPGPALAHVASFEGIKAAEAIKAEASPGSIQYHPLDYSIIPACTYCHPEVASVGLTETKAKERGFAIRIGKFPFIANGRAKASGETEGFAKIISDEKYGQILGAHIVGPSATELIGEIALGMSVEAAVENLMHTVHAHPTHSEAVMEAAAATFGESINI
jgi:dihydrolipoamide dehydrogenase